MNQNPLIELQCFAVRQETPEAKSYFFRPTSGQRLAFEPGQFLTFVFDIDGEEHQRSYTISSSVDAPGWVSITVKRVPYGVISNWLFHNMTSGAMVSAFPPAGIFTCGVTPSASLLILTAGSGVTPAASMLRSLSDRASQADITLIHFARSPEDMIFTSEMAHWTNTLPNLRIIPVITRDSQYGGWVGPVGRLSTDLIRALVPDAAERTVYCCGPETFMQDAHKILTGLGVDDDRFHVESFSSEVVEPEYQADIHKGATHKIRFEQSDQSVVVDDGGTVLKAAKQSKVRIQTSCKKGVCGTCRVKLLSGTVQIDHKGGIKQREIDQGYILACCSRPTSDIVVDR